MAILRVCGDVHGCINNRNRLPDKPSYIELCREIEPDNYSVQIGDMGFSYKDITVHLDPQYHVFFGGNHENMNTYHLCENALGDFGDVALGPFEFFFVRGAFSIDKKMRMRDEVLHGIKSWWKEEELSHRQGLKCLKLYEQLKPDVVMSHDCPYSVSNMVGNPDILQAFGYPRYMKTSTQELLQQMFELHQPKIWLAGHYHINESFIYKGTNFTFIAEREYVDFNEKWENIDG